MYLLHVFGLVIIEFAITAKVPRTTSPRTTTTSTSAPFTNKTRDLGRSHLQEAPQNPRSWHYDDDTTWPGRLCQEGQGKRQSPINIRTEAVITDVKRHFIKYGDLRLHGYQSVLVSGVNNGRTIQFTLDGDEAMHPSVSGGPLHYLYRLEQLHFHWVSEHAINGYKYPMEIHFVHIRADLSTTEALRKHDGMAIIAVFANIKSEAANDEEYLVGEAMEEVSRQLPHLTEPGDRVSGIVMNMSKLLSESEQYLAYAGSLTSPECNEVVTWIVLEKPVFMTYGQYKDFNDLFKAQYNFRRLQSNNITVFRPGFLKLKQPMIFRVFVDMYDLVTSFFVNLNRMIQNTGPLKVRY